MANALASIYNSRNAKLAREMSHQGTGNIPTQQEIQDSIDVGMGRKPASIVYGEEGLRGGMELGRIGDMPVSITDLLPADMGANALATLGKLGVAKLGALPLMAGMVASKGTKNSLSKLLMSDQLKNVPKKTEFELSHELAQRNAALPVEQGGLGLLPGNTAMDRAKAMGFDTPAYHGSKYGINGEIQDDKAYIGAQFLTDNKVIASNYAEGKTPTGINNAFVPNEIEQQGQVFPVQVKLKKPIDENTSLDDIYGAEKADELRNSEFRYDPKPFTSSVDEGSDLSLLAHMYAQFPKVRETIKQQGYDGFRFYDLESGGVTSVPFSKEQIRSRFAAFDPMQRNSANILAGGAAGGIGVNALYDLMKQDEYQ
jgi:hypothetical protein